MKTRLVVVTTFLTLLGAVIAYGQLAEKVRADIPFPFTADGKVFAAGHYTFTRDSQGQTFTFRGPDNVRGAAIVLTRLAGEIHTTPEDSHLVFDKVGDTYYLSEIWVPGSDGFLLHSTKEKHEHRVLNIPIEKNLP